MRISGRVDDMLIIRGINVFPSQIEYALMAIPEVGQHFQIVVDRKGALDDMLVRVEVSKESFSDKITDLMAIRKKCGAQAPEHSERGGERGTRRTGIAPAVRRKGKTGY